MKDIFTDFYNTILGFFRQTEKKEENAKDVACNRLRVVLMQDRTNLTPELLQRMRQELIELLSKYVEMDKDALELNFEQEGNQMALMLSIPVLRAKEESEIEEAEEKEACEDNSETDDEDTVEEDESEVEISEEEEQDGASEDSDDVVDNDETEEAEEIEK
ncbi:TPA: cell division topological specificity factor MinE [Candidatus Scatousia excrementigallinarum]|uniref:Cell division topological specificity factor n=1 Tax=Candidatus Scatousia excrementigallinarum TaxID=2840935 RepID=A0A9D1EXV7_9BACT|nr:cell division topological specificity factor MinE [Candidatus Scatousia excrementigallinarum]